MSVKGRGIFPSTPDPRASSCFGFRYSDFEFCFLWVAGLLRIVDFDRLSWRKMDGEILSKNFDAFVVICHDI